MSGLSINLKLGLSTDKGEGSPSPPIPNGALIQRNGTFILDRFSSQIVTATAPRTS